MLWMTACNILRRKTNLKFIKCSRLICKKRRQINKEKVVFIYKGFADRKWNFEWCWNMIHFNMEVESRAYYLKWTYYYFLLIFVWNKNSYVLQFVFTQNMTFKIWSTLEVENISLQKRKKTPGMKRLTLWVQGDEVIVTKTQDEIIIFIWKESVDVRWGTYIIR